ncbi:MAG: Obg family GTPase CgtA [Candidatus Omnitrophota bacterium]|jgi:GTP-binding protein|nr:MAG: Obg family GTPase CgtA [Candidatus Omnitrophota bacterium]
MFIDSVKIYVKGGRGGNGCNSVYRDKLNRRGFPDGGSGGKGADVILKADRNLRTLLDFKYNRHFYGLKGKDGSSKRKKGKTAPDLSVRVPCGVVVLDAAKNCILGSLEYDGQMLVVASGGKPGLGNQHNRDATSGEPGEERELLIDLKLIADVGIIGFPNAGKSTLISVISGAHPRIAPYPFTTKTPTLGVVKVAGGHFVAADIPGLIEGSHSGRGLGDRFLRHVERTKLLVHLIDISGCEGRNPLEDYRIIKDELRRYSPELAKKPQILAANKMDLGQAAGNLKVFRSKIRRVIYPISALNKEGLDELINAIRKKL